MARRQPASCNFGAMAQPMLRLLAKPKITAVFCESVTLAPASGIQFSDFSIPADGKEFIFSERCDFSSVHSPLATRQQPLDASSNAMKCPFNFLYGIAQNNATAVRTAHRTIGFRERCEEPFQFGLIGRQIDFDGGRARG